MTVTQTETTPAAASVTEHVTPHGDARTSGVLDAIVDHLGSGEHKAIGRKWIVGAIDLGLVCLVASVLVGIERLDLSTFSIFPNPGNEAMMQAWTLYRLGFVFMLLAPLFIGLATVIVPLQVGAASVSYPRLMSAAFWTWLTSAVIFFISHLIDGGFVGGFRRDALELTLGSFFFMVLSIMVASVCIITTVITERTEGMSLGEVPMFSWSMLVGGAMWVLTLPMLLANVIVIAIELYGDRGNYTENMWDQVRWVTDQPQVFLFAVPLLGIAADIIPTAFKNARPRGYGVTQVAIAAFAMLSFGSYAQRFFYPAVSSSPVYVMGALSLILPLLIIVGSWLDTARRANGVKLGAHVLMAILAVVSLIGAGTVAALRVLGGPFRFMDNIDVPGLRNVRWLDGANLFDDLTLARTSIDGAILNGVLGAALLGALAGLWFWSPKIFGRQMFQGAGALAGLAIAGGALAASIPDLIAGFLDDPQREMLTSGSVSSTIEGLNAVSLIGRILLLAGLLLMALNVTAILMQMLAGRTPEYDAEDDPDNPYGGHTLEWATSSPPPRGNFAAPIAVTSERPLLDLAEGDAR